jgi:hypothetical protein
MNPSSLERYAKIRSNELLTEANDANTVPVTRGGADFPRETVSFFGLRFRKPRQNASLASAAKTTQAAG